MIYVGIMVTGASAVAAILISLVLFKFRFGATLAALVSLVRLRSAVGQIPSR